MKSVTVYETETYQLFIKIYFIMLYLCVYMHECSCEFSVYRIQNVISGTLVRKLQAIVNCVTWVLGIEIKPRFNSALNHGAISAAS